MPTLFRLLFVVGIIAAMAYAALFALATFVRPEQHEITQNVTLPRQPK